MSFFVSTNEPKIMISRSIQQRLEIHTYISRNSYIYILIARDFLSIIEIKNQNKDLSIYISIVNVWIDICSLTVDR